MSIFGAMFSGVSGLAAQSQALGAISDNISNVNTVGYKATQTSFSTLITHNSDATTYAPGGVRANPVAGVTTQGLLQTSSSTTDIAVSGQGFFVVNNASQPGPSNGYVFTRAGSFTMDQNGYLKNSAGYYLQAWPTDANGNVVPAKSSVSTTNLGVISPDYLESVQLTNIGGTANPTSTLDLGANLPATDTAGTTETTNVLMYDSLGISHSVNFNWTRNTPASNNSWQLGVAPPDGADQLTMTDSSGNVTGASRRFDFTAVPAAGDTITINGTTLTAGAANTATTFAVVAGNTSSTVANIVAAYKLAQPADTRISALGSSLVATQSPTGAALTINTSSITDGVTTTSQQGSFTVPALTTPGTASITFNGDGTPNTVNVSKVAITWNNGANPSSIAVNMGTANTSNGMTQFAGSYSTNFTNQNGSHYGTFTGVSIGTDGLVTALFDNGQTRPIYKIPLATFPAPDGLETQMGNAYSATDSSGNYVLKPAVSGGAGSVAASSLESSTVDLATEFTNMIITQRAYSASSKVITTSSQMLDQLMTMVQ